MSGGDAVQKDVTGSRPQLSLLAHSDWSRLWLWPSQRFLVALALYRHLVQESLDENYQSLGVGGSKVSQKLKKHSPGDVFHIKV